MPVAGKKQGGSPGNVLLLAPVDRQQRGDEAPRRAKSNFDENETGSIAHHEVDLALAIADIAGNESEAGCLQVSARRLFGP